MLHTLQSSMHTAALLHGSSSHLQYRMASRCAGSSVSRSGALSSHQNLMTSLKCHHTWHRSIRTSAMRTETESRTQQASTSPQQHVVPSRVAVCEPESEALQQQTSLQHKEKQRPKSQRPLSRKLLTKLGPLQPVVKTVADAIGAVDPRIRGLILLNIMTFVMGTNWVVIKESNATFDPVVFTSLRFTLAAAAFAPFLMKGLKNPSVRRAGLEIGAWTALGYLAQSWALALTPASRASLLSTFTVLAVPCLAGLAGQKVKPMVFGCGIAALIGTAFLEQGGGEPPNAGDLLSIVSALFFAMQLFRTEQMSRQLPEGNSLNLMSVIITTVAAASLSSAMVIHWQDAAAAAGSLWHVVTSAVHALMPGSSGAETAQPLYELLYTSFCSTDLVLFIELMALQDVSSTEAALIYSMEPVSGALMAYAFLGERWGPMGWVGAAVIVAASIITQLGGAVDDDKDKDTSEAEATS